MSSMLLMMQADMNEYGRNAAGANGVAKAYSLATYEWHG